MHWIISAFKRVLASIFGEVTWRPPMWIRVIAQGIGRGLGWFLGRLEKQRKTALVLLLAGAALLAVYTYWPEPEVMEEPEKIVLRVSVERPGLRRLGDETMPSLMLRFDNSAAKIEQVDKEISGAGLTLEPKITGTWRWSGDRQLIFTPEKDWPLKQTYTVTIDTSFLPEHTVFEQDEITFTTLGFDAKSDGIEFVSDPVDPKRKIVVASYAFSHPVDRGSFEAHISMIYGQPDSPKGVEKYGFEVKYDTQDTRAHVHSHNIPIPKSDNTMKVRVEKGVSAKQGGPGSETVLERVVTVPGMYSYFEIEGTDLTFARDKNNDPEQIIVLKSKLDVHENEIDKRFKAWMLPEKKPASDDEDNTNEIDEAAEDDDTDYQWRASEIDAKVLRKSTPLELEHIPQEREYAGLHTLKFKAPVNRQIYMRLEKWTKAWGGYVLAETYDDIERTSPFPMELSIMHDGAILSTAGAKTLSILTRGLPGIRIELSRILKSDINHMLSQTRGRFDSPNFNYNFGPNNIAERYKETRRLDNRNPAKSQYTALDFGDFVKQHGARSDKGVFWLNVSSWSPNGDVSYLSDRRLVLITDLGIIAKQDAQENHYVFVQSVSTGKPRGGATVTILGKNGLPVLKTKTDTRGLAKFPPLNDFVNEKRPMAYVVTSGDDFSYLPIGRSDRLVNYSRFDVGGVTTQGAKDTLNAHLFSDRGIYRPGDPFRIGLIVKAADWSKSVDGIPVALVVTDPRGREVLDETRILEGGGFIDLEHTTEESSPTGNYRVDAFLLSKDKKGRDVKRDMLGSTSVRVEEFLPDTMTIKTAFTATPTDGWISPKKVAATVSLRNLYGTPATERRVAGRISLATKYLSFKGYRDYRFHDPMAAKTGYVRRLGDRYTDEAGKVEFDIDLMEFENATYALTFTAEGFEADGGRSVSSHATIIVSPLKYIIGYKTDGSLHYISRDSERRVRLVALNRLLTQRGVKGIKANLYENRYISTLVKQYNGVFKYQSVPRKVKVGSERIEIGREGLVYPLETEQPGDYILELVGHGNTVLTTIPYSVAGDRNVAKNLERSAELEVTLDKKDYIPGETINISIKAPYSGAGLITIERDSVLAHKWFTSNATRFVQSITVPKGVDVGAYVNVAMVRSLDSPEIFMKPFSTAVVPFSLKRDDRSHEIDFTVPKSIKPGEEMTVTYATPTPSKIVVFAVDEGILQVADYKTPDPLSHFLSKRALEVTTSQILDMILPEHDVYGNPASVGGGDEEDETLGRNLNPFKRRREKPMLYWSGIIDAGPEKQTVRFTVPSHFNGTIRTMAVAVSSERLGSIERRTVAKGPFVIRSSPPLFAAPGDAFEISVTVANHVEGSGKNAPVTLELSATANLEIVGATKQTLEITEGQETTTRFKMKAKAGLGNAAMRFTATHRSEAITAEATMSVRPKNPHVTTVKTGFVENGKATIPIDRRLYQEYRELNLSVSPLPLALADGLKGYLEAFPHGCTEQIVSQTVPALVLRDHTAFGYDAKTATRAVRRTIRMLQSRQNDEGAFGFWSANSHVSDQQTVYAMQFLTEAGKRGYPVSGNVMENGLKYLKRLTTGELNDRASARLRAYAIYVLALNGELSAVSLAELREHLSRDHENHWHRDVLIGYLAATYMIMQDRKEAMTLIKKVDFKQKTETDYNDFYDEQVYRGTMLHVMATHFSKQVDDIGGMVIKKIANAISRGEYNTLSSARIIYGLEAYGRVVRAALEQLSAPAVTVSQVLSKEKKTKIALKGDLIKRASFSEKARAIDIASTSELPIFYQISIAGYDLDNAEDVVVAKGVEVIREYQNLDHEPITATTLGDEILVTLKLRATRDTTIDNLAVVDLLPSGFEVVLGRKGNRIGTEDSDWSPEYADLREDRVLLYGDIGKDLRQFVYRIKATNRGAFAVPPSYVTSMYDPKITARTGSAMIQVTDSEVQ